MSETQKIVILGAGPTGLGASWRLHEFEQSHLINMNQVDWQLVDASSSPGGMSASETDSAGFTWDTGGHVLYSHYQYFDNMLNELFLEEEWETHERRGWSWYSGRFVPYPFQKNIRHLPTDDLSYCLQGLVSREQYNSHNSDAQNLQEWLLRQFGKGLCELFFFPLNSKIWACDPASLSCSWTNMRSGGTERNVPSVDVTEVICNLVDRKDSLPLADSTTLRYPKDGGSSEIWDRIFQSLPVHRTELGEEVVEIATEAKLATCRSGLKIRYDKLISSIPMCKLLDILVDRPDLQKQSDSLKFCSTHLIGLGIKGRIPSHLEDKHWIYFPEMQIPFHRATVLSNYSPQNAPAGPYWSLLCEVNVSEHRQLSRDDLAEKVVSSLHDNQLVPRDTEIVSLWQKSLLHGYPLPFIGRDRILSNLQPELEKLDIFSRGRFGGWKYEVSNQDHAFMQGVEAVDRVMLGVDEVTYFSPRMVCGRRAAGRLPLTNLLTTETARTHS